MERLTANNYTNFQLDPHHALSLYDYCLKVGKKPHPAYKSVFIHNVDGVFRVDIEECDGNLAKSMKSTRRKIVDRVHKALMGCLDTEHDVEVVWYSGFDLMRVFLLTPQGEVIG